jgi:ribonuclease BN (tRNA processing enzyme)
MGLELTFLGTGNAFAPTRYWSSFLANGRYLFDAPPTLLPHLKRLGKSPGDIEVVFISHFHADHFFGLPFLFLEWAELEPRTKDLTIVGPPGIRAGGVADGPWLQRLPQARPRLAGVFYRSGMARPAGRCRSWRGVACAGPESFAYSVECAEGSVAYYGDAIMCEALATLANDADAFVCECSGWNSNNGPHLTPEDILKLRAAVSPSTRFLLTHVNAGAPPQAIIDAGIVVAEDRRRIRSGSSDGG